MPASVPVRAGPDGRGGAQITSSYTLVVSFGDIGKAVAVVPLVMQVAGSAARSPSR